MNQEKDELNKLISDLDIGSDEQKIRAAEKIAKFGGTQGKPAIPVLIENLGSENRHVRNACLTALFNIGTKTVLDEAVRVITYQLDEETGLGPEVKLRLPLKRSLMRQYLLILLGMFDDFSMIDSGAPKHIDLFTRVITTDAHAIAKTAVSELGNHWCEKVEDALISCVKSTAFIETIIDLVNLLGEKKSKKAVTSLIDLIPRDRNIGVTAARALEQIGDKSAAKPLWEFMKTYEGESAKCGSSDYSNALAELATPDMLDEFIARLRSKDVIFKRTMIHVIGKLKDPRSIGPLLGAQPKPGDSLFAELKCNLADAFGELGVPDQRVLDYLTDMVACSDSHCAPFSTIHYVSRPSIPVKQAYRTSALKALIKIQGENANELVISELKKGDLAPENQLELISLFEPVERVRLIHDLVELRILPYDFGIDAMASIKEKLSQDNGSVSSDRKPRDVSNLMFVSPASLGTAKRVIA